MSTPVQRPGDGSEDFLRSVTPPEEDRRLYTSMPYRGGFRWFRATNVIPIEQWRRRPQSEQDQSD